MGQEFTAKVSVSITATAAKVWQALTDPALIKEYLFGTEVTTDWKPGSPVTYKGVWQGQAYEDRGKIISIIPGKKIVSTYWSSMAGTPDAPENYQDVTYEIDSDIGGKVRLTVTQGNIKTAESQKHSEQNWRTVLDGLKRLVEQGRTGGGS